jgi:1-acyl-sn-glycerol-3-phosphate acyltransferase
MRLTILANPLENSAEDYDHASLKLRRQVCRYLLRYIGFSLLAKVDRVDGLERIPQQGPGIIMINHIGFIDPLVVLHVIPRDIIPLAKVESYDYPFVGIFPRLWGVIPVQRDGIDRKAIKLALDVLDAGELILVAPEGTRNDALQRPREGAVYLASRSGAPIIPLAIEGTPGFPTLPFTSQWRGQGVHIKIGKPFRIRSKYSRARGDELKQMAEEAMYVLASILPAHRRGIFANCENSTSDMIEWVI